MPNSDFLHNNKAFRPIIGKGYPKRSEGIDGDFSLRQSNEGLKLFVKFGGDWYFVAQLIATGVNNLALGGHPTSFAKASGSIGANGGSNKAGVPTGSKLSLDTSSGRVQSRNSPPNQTYMQYSSEGGPTRNGLAKNHVKVNVAARPLLFMVEDGSASRVIGGSNTLPAGIEAKAFYISGTYGAGLGTTKILGGSNSMAFTCNDVAMATFSDAGVDFQDKDLTNIDSLDADKFSIAGGTEMVAINDEDNMASNSNTALATQQSIKAYADAGDLTTQIDYGLKTAVVTLDTADCNDLHNTAITLIAAQGANKIALVQDVVIFVDRAATQLNGGSDLFISYDGLTSLTDSVIRYRRRFVNGVLTDSIQHILPYAGLYGVALNQGDNKPVTVKVDDALTTDCMTSMKVVVKYYVYDNS